MGDLYRDSNVLSMQRIGDPSDGPFDDRFEDRFDDWPDGEADDFPGEEAFRHDHDLGRLTIRVFAGDNLLDTIRRPVEGSGYECAVLESRHPRRTAPPPPPPPRHERELAWLARLVGGAQALDALGIDRLPDEALDVSAVREDLRVRVMAIGARCDRVAEQLHDPELRTACRRLLARAVSVEPQLLLRSERDDTAAGAVLFAVARANDLLGQGRAIPASVLTELCGLRSSSHDRARSFAHAVSGPGGTGFDRYGSSRGEPDVFVLGTPDLLLGRFRAKLVRLRGLAHEERQEAHRRRTAG